VCDLYNSTHFSVVDKHDCTWRCLSFVSFVFCHFVCLFACGLVVVGFMHPFSGLGSRTEKVGRGGQKAGGQGRHAGPPCRATSHH
jgi:hypothetical protein